MDVSTGWYLNLRCTAPDSTPSSLTRVYVDPPPATSEPRTTSRRNTRALPMKSFPTMSWSQHSISIATSGLSRSEELTTKSNSQSYTGFTVWCLTGDLHR